MTPAARVAASITILDQILAGAPTERVLTTWGRSNRYAGSGDRAAIRDLVFDAVRRKRSAMADGGADTGRGLMIGLLSQQDADLARLFDGSAYGPDPIADGEGKAQSKSRGQTLDVQDWCLPLLDAALDSKTDAVCHILRDRAPIFLRAHLGKTDRKTLIETLAGDGVEAETHPLSPSAVLVTSGARKLRRTVAFEDGLFEFQDAASQAVVDTLGEDLSGAVVLDYCAGGGGKALALAARGAVVSAYDSDAGRMKDIPERARRASTEITVLTDRPAGLTFDLVLVDAPCSGSGAWRRQPDAKWALTTAELDRLTVLQSDILTAAASFVRPGGTLAYATCSLFAQENQDQVAGFLATHPDWTCDAQRAFTPLDGGDGFFSAQLRAPGGA